MGTTLTVGVRRASMGTTPWSVITARFSSSLAMLAIAAHTLANTPISLWELDKTDNLKIKRKSFFTGKNIEKATSDFSSPTMSSKPPTKDRTISPAS